MRAGLKANTDCYSHAQYLPFSSNPTYMQSIFLSLTKFALRNPNGVSKLPISPFSTAARAMAQEYKIKGLSSLDLKSGEKREVEVEGIENGKVLLAKVGDKTHAMSPNCTHYGAPLKLGVLTPDGRLTCAWHGGLSTPSLCLTRARLC